MGKRIDLAAPLISVRRHGGAGAVVTDMGAGLPVYKADATSGPLGRTGAVPFRWEHRPGHPKSVRTRRPHAPPPPAPTAAIVVEEEAAAATTTRTPPAAVVTAARAHAEDDELERFSDARDTLSRDDDGDDASVTVNCSTTGLSDAAAGAGAGPGHVARGGVMMDRFLPAAHAVAAGSPPCAFRKAGSAARPAAAIAIALAADDGASRRPAQRRLPLQRVATTHPPPLPPERKDNDDDDAKSDAHSTRGFASRRCGLLPTTRCVKSALLLSCGSRRGAGMGRPLLSACGGSKRAMDPPLRRSQKGQQPQHTGDDSSMQSWEEAYVKSLLRSGRGGLMGPAAAVASELDRTVRELYRRRGGQAAVHPKSTHLGLLLVLDRSNEDRGHGSSARRKVSGTSDTTALLLPPAAATSSPPSAEKKKLGRGAAAGGGYGFPLLLEDKEAVTAGREIVLSPQPPLLSPPLPKSPSESWLARALPSASTRPPATSFLGLHVQSRKHAPLPWCSIDSDRVDGHGRQRQVRVHGLLK